MAIDRGKIQKLAESYMASGKVDRAIDEFLKLIEDRPDDSQLLNRVGDAYLQAGKVPEAVEMFKRAGSGFERGGFNAKATAVFKKAHRVVGDDVEIAERLAELYRGTNMIKEAIQIHIEVADVFTKKGLIKRALEEFAKVVDLDPKNLKNKVKLADLYNKEGMKERAANIYLEVAEALALDQMHSEANQILERAKTMVTTPQVFLTQSRLFVIQKDLQAAANHLREGLVANPRSPELLDALAEVELQAKSPERALEALAQVPQLPEKSLLLCERALREMVRTNNVDEGLRLFKPIGREFARRGLGEPAAKALRAALQGSVTVEAWVQLAEIAHQSGNRADQVECLRHAFAQADAQNDRVLAETISQQLQGMGFRMEDISAPFAASPAPAPRVEVVEPVVFSEKTEMDPVRRLQIQQLERDADHSMRNRFMDRALETYTKILDLEPANLEAINHIADIHRVTGMLTKVQMHYVRTAEKIVPLGFKALAVELLDRAEALFPGSTRLYRRTLGLEGVLKAAPSPAAIALPEPKAEPPRIELDMEPRSAAAAFPAPQPSAEEFFALPPIEELSPLPLAAAEVSGIPEWGSLADFEAPVEPSPVAEVLPDPAEFDWSEITGGLSAPEAENPFAPLVLEPLPFATGTPAVPALAPAPPAFVAEDPALAAPVPEELASTLSDIDFQLDYGSPEEAKLEIEAALVNYPQHPELMKRLDQAEQALHRLGHTRPESLQESDFAQSFFDLTDVLGDALMESGDGEEMHDATNVVEKIQSVDELFNAFREGVEQQVKGDDYDTHYNLGIAYKEMLLLEPAMEEFKKAMRDPERTLECCSMLSICEQSQGNLDAAIQWLHQGIDAPGFPPEDSMGLRYDLGLMLREQGLAGQAREQFQLVADLEPDYRDVAQLLG